MTLALVAACAAVAWPQQPPPPPRFDTQFPPPAVPGNPAAYPAQPAVGPTVYPDPPAAELPQRLPPANAGRGSPDPAAAGAGRGSPDPAGTPPAGAAAWRAEAHPTRVPQPGAAPAASASPPPPEVFTPGRIIAWVGNLPIQSGDIMPTIEQMLAPTLAQLTPEQLEDNREAIEQQKEKLLQQALAGAIETKLLYLEFLRALPADKKKEALPTITKRAEEQFDEQQLPEAMEKAQVESLIELDAAFRKYGSSLAQQKRLYVERILGQSVLGQKIDYRPEITHQEMLDYYRENAEEFERPARARWEILTVRFDRFASKAEAWAALGEMGNEVLGGAPLSAVARRRSQGAEAAEGGYHDWTTRGSLASATLDEAIFNLPIGRLSQRLEDQRGFHIVRVIEREDAGSVPFREAQVEIKETIRRQKIRQQIADYVVKLRDEITVWTIYDEEAASTADRSTAPGGPARGPGDSGNAPASNAPTGNAPWPSTYRR